MAKDLWLPRSFELPDGSKTKALLFSGDNWQIFNTDGSDHLLLLKTELAQKLCSNKYIEESLLMEVKFGPMAFKGLCSHKKYSLIPVEQYKPPETKEDAMAFALAMKESRKLSEDASLHDSIYVEQYSILLPTYTLSPYVEDELIFGTWLTGGVKVSTNSFRRLRHFAWWLPANQLADIVGIAGLNVPANRNELNQNDTSFTSNIDQQPLVIHDDDDEDHDLESTSNVEQKVFRLPGRPHLEDFFNEHVIDIIFNPEKYKTMGIEFPSAIVLHGPPGCGKTFAVEKLVELIDWPSYSIDSSSVGSPYIHETSKKISDIFTKAMDNAPSVMIIDEMESFLSDRQSGGSGGLHHVEEVAEFLRRIPQAIKNKVLIIAMTNMIDLIDPAILRRGRFDHIIEVGMPEREEVKSLLESLLNKLPKKENLKIDVLLDKLSGKALSDAAFVVREAGRIAAKKGMEQLDQDSIESALQSLPDENNNQTKPIGFVWD